MVISLINFKGGVGKSLIAHQLITGFKYSGIEFDDYGNLSDRLPEKVIRVAKKGGAKYLEENKLKNVILDFGGYDSKALRKAMEISDVAVVPFIPTVESVQTTLDTIAALKKEAKLPPVLFVANQALKIDTIKKVKALFDRLMKEDTNMFVLPQSVALQSALSENRCVIDIAKSGDLRSFGFRKIAVKIEDLQKAIKILGKSGRQSRKKSN